jgi:ABC transporter substrate binding protein
MSADCPAAIGYSASRSLGLEGPDAFPSMETARGDRAARWRRGMAAGGASAATNDASGWPCQRSVARGLREHCSRVPQGPPPQSVVLLLADPTTHRESRPALDATAAALGLTLREAIVGTPGQIERSLREAKDAGAAGVNVLSSALLFALRARIISLAAELGLPAIYQWPETADEGGLIAYGPSLRGAFRQVTTLVDKILKGAKPGDMPVEQPTRFSLVINLRTANALGLTVQPLTLLRADRAIE